MFARYFDASIQVSETSTWTFSLEQDRSCSLKSGEVDGARVSPHLPVPLETRQVPRWRAKRMRLTLQPCSTPARSKRPFVNSEVFFFFNLCFSVAQERDHVWMRSDLQIHSPHNLSSSSPPTRTNQHLIDRHTLEVMSTLTSGHITRSPPINTQWGYAILTAKPSWCILHLLSIGQQLQLSISCIIRM